MVQVDIVCVFLLFMLLGGREIEPDTTLVTQRISC